MTTISNFVKEVLARITGDTDTVIAQRNQRKASAAIRSQINALESEIVDLEIVVEEKTEALKAARYPTVLIEDAAAYLESISDAKLDLEKAKESLQYVKDELAVWQAEMGLLFDGEEA